jgi:Na+/serine symporter
MSPADSRPARPSSPWRVVRWGAFAALLLVVALLAADVGASFVAGGHLHLVPDAHFSSTIALSDPPAAPPHGVGTIAPAAG